eukprot:c18120_g1_i1 orf=330-1799(-)
MRARKEPRRYRFVALPACLLFIAVCSEMGGFWSFARGDSSEQEKMSVVQLSKKRRMLSSDLKENPQLIPGLPDELSLRILARVPRGSHSSLKLVCVAWHEAFTGKEMFGIRKELGITEEWLYILLKDEDDRLWWQALDPLTGRWERLPSMPDMSSDDELEHGSSGWSWFASMGFSSMSLLRGLFRRNDSVDKSPFCGCAAGSLNGYLYVIGGFLRACATKCVWRYDPRTNEWTEAAAMSTPRAYCKTAFLRDKLYVVGGVNRGGGGLTPLQSAEVYDAATNTWKFIPSMPFARAQILPTAFLADIPIATGMASFRGKLFVPQSLYSFPFFIDVGGEIFDPDTDTWTDMPQGMGEGWPARQAGTKLSVVINGSLYALDPTSSLDGSKVKVYDSEADAWKVVLKKAPVLLDLTDSESPYLLAGFKGKLHVITKDINDNLTVLRADVNDTSPSSSSSKVGSSSSESETEGWKSIANKNFGMVELVTCQVLDL